MRLTPFCLAVTLLLSLSPKGLVFAQEDEINAFYQEVIAALSEQPSPTFPMEADVLVNFTIADDGSIEIATVTQSSGSDPLDQTALLVVQNAAPFPPPPDGANRNLSITIRSIRPTLSFGNIQ